MIPIMFVREGVCGSQLSAIEQYKGKAMRGP